MRCALALRCYRGAKACLARFDQAKPIRALAWACLGWLLIEWAHLLLEVE